MDKNTLRNLADKALVIKNETRQKANTAARVGGLLGEIIEQFGSELIRDNARTIIEFDTFSDLPATGSPDSIYLITDNNVFYRWDGEQYLALNGPNAETPAFHYVNAIVVESLENPPRNKFIICNSVLYRTMLNHPIISPLNVVNIEDAIVYQNDGNGNLTTIEPTENINYINDRTGDVYIWDANAECFRSISNYEIDETIYVVYDKNDYSFEDAITRKLATVTTVGFYEVVVIEASTVSNTTFKLSVNINASEFEQSLENRDGYYTRQTATEGNERYWGEWTHRAYPYIDDNRQSETTVYSSEKIEKQFAKLEKNYTYKIEDTIVANWTTSEKYDNYGFQAQIDIEGLTEQDAVSVVFHTAAAISNLYAPSGELHNGYILIFSKVDAVVMIPSIIVTKINLE